MEDYQMLILLSQYRCMYCVLFILTLSLYHMFKIRFNMNICLGCFYHCREIKLEKNALTLLG